MRAKAVETWQHKEKRWIKRLHICALITLYMPLCYYIWVLSSIRARKTSGADGTHTTGYIVMGPHNKKKIYIWVLWTSGASGTHTPNMGPPNMGPHTKNKAECGPSSTNKKTIYWSSGRRAQAARTPQQWYQNSWPAFSRSTARYSDCFLYWYKSANTDAVSCGCKGERDDFSFSFGIEGGAEGEGEEGTFSSQKPRDYFMPTRNVAFSFGFEQGCGNAEDCWGGGGDGEREQREMAAVSGQGGEGEGEGRGGGGPLVFILGKQ